MVINNGDSCRSVLCPLKDNTPLIVDANGMKTCQVASQAFQAVSWRNGQVIQGARLIHLNELSQCDP